MSQQFDLDHYRKQLCRSAVGFEIGGFRPSDDPASSWFGRINLCSDGESWPEHNGKPLHALCQINLTDVPFRPSRMDDLELLTVFVSGDELPDNDPNGTSWCIRAYPSIASLTPLVQADTSSEIREFPMRPYEIVVDYPMWEDVRIDLPPELEEKYYDYFDNVGGLKLGGWPTLIQSEIYWAPYQKHPIRPEYVFQVDSTKKCNWMWGDSGVGYFGRGTAPGGENEWACEWQCY